ncbi:MAG: patatin-like phospholipase family protein, partial [Anaerolineales bacterium]
MSFTAPLQAAGIPPETASAGQEEPSSRQPGITLHPRLQEALEQARASGRRPRIGLALSGGGARGLAHIGALAALEEIGIPVDRLAGTSMGAIVGGLYASGYSISDIERIAAESNWRLLFSDLPERRTLGLLQKERFHRTLFELGLERGRLGSTGGLVAGQRLSARFAALTLHVA